MSGAASRDAVEAGYAPAADPAAPPPAGSRIEILVPAPNAARTARRRRRTERLIAVLSPIIFLALWEACVALSLLDARFFPPPSVIAVTFVELIRSGVLADNTLISLSRIAVGFLMGGIPGIIVGTVMGLSRVVRAALNPIVGAIYPIPKTALLPLILLIFGLGEMSKYVTIAIAVFFFVLINTMAGVMSVEQIYWDVGKNFKASRLNVFRTIAVPGAMPMIFAGLRLAWGVSLLVLVAAEFVGAKSGIGYMIWSSWQIFDIPQMFAGLIVIGFLGWASFIVIDELERYVLPWRTVNQK